jgi:hypothetical protein
VYLPVSQAGLQLCICQSVRITVVYLSVSQDYSCVSASQSGRVTVMYQSVRITVVYLPVSQHYTLLLCSQKVLKYADTNVIEF